MRKLIYRDLDEFARCLDGLEGHFVPTARQKADWWIQRATARCHWIQVFQTGSPATFAGQARSDAVIVAAPLTAEGALRVNGHALGPDELVLLREGQPFTFVSHDVVCWAALCLRKLARLIPPEVFSTRAAHGPRIRTPPAQLECLRRIITRTLAHLESVDSSEPGAATFALEQELALCLTHLLEHSTMPSMSRRLTRPPVPRSSVIARTLSLIDARQGEPLFISDLCGAAGVSERTLRNIFHEYFGVGPMRLLKALQLQNIRVALLRADPDRDKVTHIAAEYGVSDFSLFARNYKAMYGETASVALRTPPVNPDRDRAKFGWLYYAARLGDEDRGGLLKQAPGDGEGRH